ncbi:hypothetical protein TNCV_933991 [Trichonephila clavipes]|nr:hypothetical protein TNCV_933991 [Trichonephila clavipes]
MPIPLGYRGHIFIAKQTKMQMCVCVCVYHLVFRLSLPLELRIKNGPAKSIPVRWNTEEGQTLDSGRSPMICSANFGRFLKLGIHLLTTLLTASRAERIQNFFSESCLEKLWTGMKKFQGYPSRSTVSRILQTTHKVSVHVRSQLLNLCHSISYKRLPSSRFGLQPCQCDLGIRLRKGLGIGRVRVGKVACNTNWQEVRQNKALVEVETEFLLERHVS